MRQQSIAVIGSQPSVAARALAALPSLTTIPLSDGDGGTAETIDYIRKLVDQGVKDPFINRTAIAIIHAARIRSFDLSGEIRAIYEWVLRNIRFTRDIAGKETLRSARETLTVRAGDCDDINGILLPSLLGTVGHRMRLVTISAHPVSPNFSHIYAEVLLGNKWIPVDAARRDAAFGKGPARYSRKRIWAINSDDYADVQGMRGLGYYSAAPGRGMGDWSDFLDPSLISSVGNAASSIVRSFTAPTVPSIVISPTGQQLTPGATSLLQQIPSQMPSWLIPVGLGVAVIALLKGK